MLISKIRFLCSLSFLLRGRLNNCPPPWMQPSEQIFAWFLDAANKTSLEIFLHLLVLNQKYLWFEKISVSLWCSMVGRHLFNFLSFRFYLIIYIFVLFLFFVYHHFVFYKENLIKTKYFLLEKNTMTDECHFWGLQTMS